MKIHQGIDQIQYIENAVITVGTFDGVHMGHQKVLNRVINRAKEVQGASVLMTFYPHPRMIVKPNNLDLKLLNTQEEKIKLLEKLGIDHLIVIPFTESFSRMAPIEYVRDLLVNKIGMKHIIIGYDHRFGRNRMGNIDTLLEYSEIYHFSVEEISALELDDMNISSTKIRKALASGDIDKANTYLTYPYSIGGIVIKGDQIGRTLGFPTANIAPTDWYKLIPKDGVYAVKINYNDKEYKGMLNIGQRPSISANASEKRIEVHIFDFTKDIYGQYIEINFVSFIREEQKFESLAALKNQLCKDQSQVLSLFA